MLAAGFLLLAALPVSPLADPAPGSGPVAGPAVGSPRLVRGDELAYAGHVEEAGERVGNRFRKRAELDVRVFVLDAAGGVADCAVLTRVRPLADPVVAGPTAAATGADPAARPAPPAARLELVRVDAQGRVVRLLPPPGPSPLSLGPVTPTAPALPVALDGPPVAELGMFVPLPPRPAGLGTEWGTPDPGRPPVVRAVRREAVWNGGRCLEVAVTQASDGWDTPAAAVTGWKRADTVLTVPGDGYACSVARRVERREANKLVGWVEVRYEITAVRNHTARYADVRRDAEAAYSAAAELAPLFARAAKTDPREFTKAAARLARSAADQPFPTDFREAVDAVRRRCEAAARGDAAPAADVVPASFGTAPDPPARGRPAADFVVPLVHAADPFRLSAGRGKPAVLVFFKPGSKTARGALAVAEALHTTFAGAATVATVAVADPDAAARQRAEMRLTVPVADGAGVRALYAVDSYPKFFVIDAAGLLTWQFDGYGAETGYLVRQEVERLLK